MVQLQQTGGRLGNQLFEYAFGRIIAEELGYRFEHNLGADELKNNFKLPKVIEGKSFETPIQKIDCLHKWSPTLLEEIINDKKDRKIILNGYFQKYIYYKNYKHKLKDWFKFDCNKHNYDDAIGVHIRKTDFKNSIYDMPDDYFLKILRAEAFNKIFITSDEPENETINKIKKEFKNVELFSGSPYETMEHFVCFKKLILSLGTFSWWIGFLSNADKVYMPDKVTHEIDLRVKDDLRYIFL